MKILNGLLALSFLTACQGAIHEAGHGPLQTDHRPTEAGIVGGQIVDASAPLAQRAFNLQIREFISNKDIYSKDDYPFEGANGSQCTASLIGRRVLLTAAHCLKANFIDITVFFPKVGGGRIAIRGMDYVIHPGHATSQDDDLALIELAHPAPASAEVLTLPDSKTDYKPKTIQAAGFGRINGRMKSAPPVDGFLRTVNLAVRTYSRSKKTFVVDQTKGRGVCRGDSGGPGILAHGGKNVVLGVVSRTSHLETSDEDPDVCSYSGIYINLQTQTAWIRKALAELEQRKQPPVNLLLKAPPGFE